MTIRYAGSGETMIPGDIYIFQFQLPSWATNAFWSTTEGSNLKTALSEAVHTVTVSPVQGQERYGVVGDSEGLLSPDIYSVSVKAVSPGTVDPVWTALANALNQAISAANKTGIVTPYYHAGAGSAPLSGINWTPIAILLGIGALVYFLGRSGY